MSTVLYGCFVLKNLFLKNVRTYKNSPGIAFYPILEFKSFATEIKNPSKLH